MKACLKLFFLFLLVNCQAKQDKPKAKIILKMISAAEQKKKIDLLTGFYWVDFSEKGIQKETYLKDQRLYYHLLTKPFITSSNFQNIQPYFDGKSWGLKIDLDPPGQAIIKSASKNLYESFGFIVNGSLVCILGFSKKMDGKTIEISFPYFSQADVNALLIFL